MFQQIPGRTQRIQERGTHRRYGQRLLALIGGQALHQLFELDALSEDRGQVGDLTLTSSHSGPQQCQHHVARRHIRVHDLLHHQGRHLDRHRLYVIGLGEHPSRRVSCCICGDDGRCSQPMRRRDAARRRIYRGRQQPAAQRIGLEQFVGSKVTACTARPDRSASSAWVTASISI